MSEIMEVKAMIDDIQAMKQAVERMNGTFYEHEKSYQGYYGKEKCDHMAKFPGSKYELGLIKDADGTYRLEYDAMLEDVIGKDAGKLMDLYHMEKGFNAALAMGLTATEHKLDDGTLELVIEMEY